MASHSTTVSMTAPWLRTTSMERAKPIIRMAKIMPLEDSINCSAWSVRLIRLTKPVTIMKPRNRAASSVRYQYSLPSVMLSSSRT